MRTPSQPHPCTSGSQRFHRPLGPSAALLATAALLAASLAVPAANGGTESLRSEHTALFWSPDGASHEITSHGPVATDALGPRAPVYPGFSEQQTAASFPGGNAWLAVDDSEAGDSPLKFRNGDRITIESWIQLNSIANDRNIYVVGKGRTDRNGTNQNYALRLRGQNGDACVSFLFRSADGWHRWTSDTGFKAGGRWQHIAVSYTFGEPDSVRGYVNGQEIAGQWDMDGPTTTQPVVDDDQIWIGSALAGAAGNSFHGRIAAVAVHREALPADVLTARFQFDPSKIETRPVRLVEGRVSAEIIEGLEAHNSWPAEDFELAEPVVEWEEDVLGFVRIPARYNGDGLRAAWNTPMLFRSAATIELPAGESRLLIRSRGAARLKIDGDIVATIGAMRTGGNAHQPVEPVPDAISDHVRPLPYADRETLVTVTSDGGPHLLQFESILGARNVYPAFSETLVAIETEPGHFEVLAADADNRVPLVEGGAFEHWKRDRIVFHEALDQQFRQPGRERHRDYWNQRHQLARQFIESLPTLAIPSAADLPWPAHNEVDRFLGAKAAVFYQQGPATDIDATTGIDFHEQIHPILAEHCFDCHGERERGGLKLDSRDAALLAGDSGLQALVPGDPHASFLLEVVKLPADDEQRMPPRGEPLSADEIDLLQRWITAGAHWPEHTIDQVVLEPTDLTDDYAFIRRAYLDTVGQFPTSDEIRAFVDSTEPDKRDHLIDHLLADERWADHWTSYWQDVLAENPSFLKPSLNNTGPFRWWIHDSLRDDLPVDWFVTELIRMEGSVHDGGPAGFGMAAENDVPMAEKALVLSTAFLGTEMKCARCHDSPYHDTTQEDLFQMAAMLEQRPIRIPASSSVPAGFFVNRSSTLINLTLKTGDTVGPAWPFEDYLESFDASGVSLNGRNGSREELAAIITSPHNERFARVVVNRVWQRLMGTGIVEPVDDWEGNPPSHPELLEWLAREFVANGYDLKHVTRLVMQSHAYQRVAAAEPGANPPRDPARRLFAAPDRRRLTAEQVVDGYAKAVGLHLDVEELSFNPDTRGGKDQGRTLGVPRRAWEFNALSNERDRPSLALPRVQAVIDIMEVMGWRPARAEALTYRNHEPNLLQPGILANGVFGMWLTRLTDDLELVELAVAEKSLDDMIEELFLRLLSRPPVSTEREWFVRLLEPGFDDRVVPAGERQPVPQWERLPGVSWANHLSPEANTITEEREQRTRAGDPVTPRLRNDWRERFEDGIWSLINSPEAIFVP